MQFKQEVTVPISKGYKELKEKEEEEEKIEIKMRQEQCPGVRVRAAAVQWEKGKIAHDGHKMKDKRASSEGVDKKLQTKKDNEKMLDTKCGSRNAQQFTEQEDSPAYVDAAVKKQDMTFSGSKKADLNVERNETNQEQTKEEEKKIMKREFDETEEEPVKIEFIDQGLLATEAGLNVDRSEYSQEKRRKSKDEKESGCEFISSENDETEEEPINSESVDQGLLTKEVELNIEWAENSEKQRKEEESTEIMKREEDETETQPVKSLFIELATETGLNFERTENTQEQGSEEEEECVDGIVKRENDEIEEDPIKSESTDQGLLTKEVELNAERIENSQEQRGEEESVSQIVKGGKDETGGELVESTFTEEGLQAKEADLHVERNENDQEQGSKWEEEFVHEIRKKENDDTEDEPIKNEITDQGLLTKQTSLNVESNEYSEEEQRTKSKDEKESGNEFMTRENDEIEEEPINSEFTDQGLLIKDVELSVERIESSQEQRRKQEEEEEDAEIMKREKDEPAEELVKCKFTDQGLLGEEADLHVERNENNQEQGRKLEEEGVDEIMRENDETRDEPIKCEFSEQSLLTQETDRNIERNENQEQGSEEGLVDEILKIENDDTEEESIKSEFIIQGLLTSEFELNVVRNENSPEQGRKQEEESVDKITRSENDEARDEPIKCEFAEQSLLCKETDRNGERNENNQEQGRKPEEEEEIVDEISGLMSQYDETEEEPVKGNFIDQGVNPEEQASVCDMGNTAVVQAISVEKIMERAHDQDKNELNVIEQSIHVTTEHENEASKSQLVDEGSFIQLTSTWEGKDHLNDCLKMEKEMTENATLFQEKEMAEVDNEETKQETVGQEKDQYHEEFPAWEQFTGTAIVEEQKVCYKEMPENLKLVTDKVSDRSVEPESELLETICIEHAEIYKKVSEPSTTFEDEENNLAVTMKLQQLEQCKEQNTTSEVALNIDLGQLEDADHDHNGSRRPTLVTNRDVEGVIFRPETETGNQMETVETTSNFRAEVAAVDVKKSAEIETSSHEQPIDREEVVLQETVGHCVLEQETLLEESADTRTNELSLLKAPFSEIKSVPLEQANDSAVESDDEMQTSSLQELEKCSSEAQIQVEGKSSSPKQIAEVFQTLGEVTGMSEDELKCEQAQPECEIYLVENTCDESILHGTPLEDHMNQDECPLRDSTAEASSHRPQTGLSEALYIPERESEQETPEMQKDSQKDTEEQEKKDEAEDGLLAEIKDVPSCSGVVEEIASGLTKKSEDSEWELLREMEARERELESHEEMSENNMNVELLKDTWERDTEMVAEITDIESMVISASGEMESVENMEEPIAEEEKEKCQLDFSESEDSQELSKELEEKVEHGESVVDSKENVEERGRPGLKRGFEKMAGDNDKDKPSVLTDLLLPSQVKC